MDNSKIINLSDEQKKKRRREEVKEIIEEGRKFADLHEFMATLLEAYKEYFKEPKYQIINQVRLKELQYSLEKISKIVKDNDPNAKIEYNLF